MSQAQQFPTVMYFPNQDTVTAQAQQQPLNKVMVVGRRVSDDVDAVIHFYISLVFPNEHSINLNINPSGVGRNIMDGLLQVQYKHYAYSEGATIVFAVPAAHSGGKTVAEAVAHVLGNQRDKYTFNDRGYGCRHWCTVVLQDLVDGNFIPGNTPELFRAWKAQQYSTFGGTAIPVPEGPGTFY